MQDGESDERAHEAEAEGDTEEMNNFFPGGSRSSESVCVNSLRERSVGPTGAAHN